MNATSCSSVESLRASHNPQNYLNAITTVFPCPAQSGFERAYWLYQCREAVQWINKFVSQEYKRQLTDIEDRGLTSDLYQIIPKERQESRVRLDKLRDKFPETFAELVHIRASDANKILGRKTLYKLAKEKLGSDAIREYEAVNVGDLEKVLTPAQAVGLIDTYTKVTDWIIQEVEQ